MLILPLKRQIGLWLISALLLGAVIPCASGAQDEAFLSVTGPCRQRFPADHGQHPGYRTEWWYYTGNVQSASGAPYGYQFTIFRTQISPPGAAAQWPQPASQWRTQQIYLAHAALTDVNGRRHHQAEKTARGALSLAGAETDSATTRVWLHDWTVRIATDRQRIEMSSPQFNFTLDLIPEKPPVLHGDRGYSRKGHAPERASCYYSITRLATEGSISIDGQKMPVKGWSWMDHEYSSAALETGVIGWDWFGLMLSNGFELMVYLLRDDDGGYHPVSGGTLVDPSGQGQPLRLDQIAVDVLDRWQSPHSAAVYPARWRLAIQDVQLVLTVTSRLADQEMLTPRSTNITYWEGSVAAEGRMGAKTVTALGYVELTGYAQPLSDAH